jgi:hypothetical protein
MIARLKIVKDRGCCLRINVDILNIELDKLK